MKRFLILALFGLATSLTGIGVSAQAAPNIGSFTQIHDMEDGYFYSHYSTVAYHAKQRKQNAYIWNNTHIKKIANLKTHPNYTWYQLSSGTYKGSKHWIRVTNFPDTTRGWVHKSQLKKGFNPQGYQVLQKRYVTPTYAGNAFHLDSKTKNVYLWDWSHTKKRANLKHYTTQTFGQRHSILVQHNGRKSWYSYVDVTIKGRTVSGYVQTSQLLKGRTLHHAGQNLLFPDEFVGTKDYQQYIRDSKYQKLARSIVNLFPNTPVDYGLSRIAAYNYATNDTWFEDAPEPISTSGYTQFVAFTPIVNYLMTHKTQSNAKKLAAVEKLLAQQGYTPAKRKKLKNYKLGIYVINNLKGGRVDESDNLYKGNWYGLVLSKKATH
ncbi:hypothetical protein GTO98_00640 [Lactiplantibacillus plantarum]|nr:hypothetical protein [Lactiplantibacillus plantarum]MBO2705974.1 hypothetical protein [Lactiplantibacillus plantarum]